MKEPHRKGIANHSNPESCAGGGNIAGEALTGAHAGQVLSSEITSIGMPTSSPEGEGHAVNSVQRELFSDVAESETLSMCGNSMHGTGRPWKLPCRMAAGDGPRRLVAVRRTCTFPGSRTVP